MGILDQLPTGAVAKEGYVLEAELTWTGKSFEKNVAVHVSSNGCIANVIKKDQKTQLEGLKSLRHVNLTGYALLPGMVNAHSHAFQRGLRGLGEIYPKNSGTNSFWTWRQEMYKLVEEMNDAKMYELSKQCFSEMRDAGITTVGEFHYFHHGQVKQSKQQAFAYDEKVLEAANEVGIRIVLLNAFYEFGGFNREQMTTPQKRFKVSSHEEFWQQMDHLQRKLAPTQSLGVVAHSMRAVDLSDIVKLHEESVRRKLVFHIHLEEQMKEVNDCQQTHKKSPMALLLEKLRIDEKFTAVHCTWTEADLLEAFVQKKGNVCICPLTEGNLGDGFPALSKCSDRICLGTDCNARIDMCEEMRWLEYAHRLREGRRGVCTDATNETDLARLLFTYATKNGARSLNVNAGEIKPGYVADFALLDLNEEQLKHSAAPTSLMASFVFGCGGSSVIKATCVDGKWRKTAYNLPVETPAVVSLSEETKTQLEAATKLADVTSDDVLKLSCGLMNIPSTSGEEEKCCRAIEKWLQSRGWQVVMQKVPPQGDAAVQAERHNVYASRLGTKSPRVLFNSHIDTVPPFLPARTDGKKLYGRGSCDAKSQIAAQMLAAQKLVDDGFGDDVGLLFVVSEETDHSGMKKANELDLRPAHMVVGEPTGMKMIKLQKGILKLRLTKKGVAAHSGYPHLGESAIDPLLDVLHDLKREKWPSTKELGATTLNIGILNGGQAANALAESASAMLMFRLTEEPDKILRRVKEIIASRVEVELYTSNAPVPLSVVEGYETDVASFNTDIPYFKSDGKAYLIGAGSITDAHCSREYIEIADLRKLVDLYYNLGRKLIHGSK